MGERIKTRVKELLESLIGEEGEICLENHPAKANGYYARDLLTLVGLVEALYALDGTFLSVPRGKTACTRY